MSQPGPARPTLAIVGGTGPQGRGLALRLAAAGHQVVIGSRDSARAEEVAQRLTEALAAFVVTGEAGRVTAATNAVAAQAADIVVVAVPWAGHAELLTQLAEVLAGKVVVDCVNPLGFDQHGAFALDVAEGSATQQAAALLPGARVVGAFHHVSAALLEDVSVERLELDVLVVGDDREATDLVQELAGRIPGMRGVYGGRLRNAGQVEALTANLISINRRYRAHAGLRVTDV